MADLDMYFTFIPLPTPLSRPSKKHYTFTRECSVIETADEFNNVTIGLDLNKDIIPVCRAVDPVSFQPMVILFVPKKGWWFQTTMAVAQEFKEKYLENI